MLAGGTTLGVLAFTLLPAVAVVRSGFHLRPRLDWRDPTVRTVGRRGAWAGGQLALANVLLAAVLVLANGVAGGVVTWTFAYAFFLLPFALFAVPVATTMFPSLARSHQGGRPAEFGAALGRGGAGHGGAAGRRRRRPRRPGVAHRAHRRLRRRRATAAWRPSPTPSPPSPRAWSATASLYLLTRASYAVDDARTPFVATAVGTVAGVVVMIAPSAWAPTSERAAALAVGYGAAYLVATVVLAVALGRRLGPDRPHPLGTVARVVAAGR